MLPANAPESTPGSPDGPAMPPLSGVVPFEASLRFCAVSPEGTSTLLAHLRDAVGLLATYAGFVEARIGRAIDDESLVLVQVLWESVGAYRRALSSYDVKLTVVPLLSQALDEPTAFEILHSRNADGAVDITGNLAADAGSVSLGSAAAEHVRPAPS